MSSPGLVQWLRSQSLFRSVAFHLHGAIRPSVSVVADFSFRNFFFLFFLFFFLLQTASFSSFRKQSHDSDYYAANFLLLVRFLYVPAPPRPSDLVLLLGSGQRGVFNVRNALRTCCVRGSEANADSVHRCRTHQNYCQNPASIGR